MQIKLLHRTTKNYYIVNRDFSLIIAVLTKTHSSAIVDTLNDRHEIRYYGTQGIPIGLACEGKHGTGNDDATL